MGRAGQCPAQGGGGHACLADGPGGRAGAGWVGPTGSAQSGRKFFFEFIFNAKTNSRKV
jgi:hypothetical protein